LCASRTPLANKAYRECERVLFAGKLIIRSQQEFKGSSNGLIHGYEPDKEVVATEERETKEVEGVCRDQRMTGKGKGKEGTRLG
jgi:hypothetical protein